MAPTPVLPKKLLLAESPAAGRKGLLYRDAAGGKHHNGVGTDRMIPHFLETAGTEGIAFLHFSAAFQTVHPAHLSFCAAAIHCTVGNGL